MPAYDKCPICHKSWSNCPHSVADVDEFNFKMKVKGAMSNGPQFFQTKMGMRLFESEIPKFLKILERIADAMEAKNKSENKLEIATALQETLRTYGHPTDATLEPSRKILRAFIDQLQSNKTVVSSIEAQPKRSNISQTMGCGGCGSNRFNILKEKDDNEQTVLVAKCMECSGYTIIRPYSKGLDIRDWGGNGGLCVMEPKKS